jgi:hypothetical protein
MNYCAQCSMQIPSSDIVAVDFVLDKTFCSNCWRMCTKCHQPTYFHTTPVFNGIGVDPSYSMLCESCTEEYQLYVDPPCPSHPAA